jgi:hypothetical protein
LIPLFIFLFFFVGSIAVSAIAMIYYPQYIYLAHLLSSILIAIALSFSVPLMKSISRPQALRVISDKWFRIGLIVLTFIIIFLSFYYGDMPQT